MKTIPKIIVRDFDPKKDTPNPTFKVKVNGLQMTIFLSKLRTMFRGYLDTVELSDIRNQTALDTVVFFLAKKNIEASIKQTEKLIICFRSDINRKLNGQPYGMLK